MIGPGIADSEIEERRVRDLHEVDQAKDEREQRDRQQQVERRSPPVSLSKRRVYLLGS